jgi:hypothetical protein
MAQAILSLVTVMVLLTWIVFGVGYLWESRSFRRDDRICYVGSDIRELIPILEDVITRYLGPDTEKYTWVEPGAGLGRITSSMARRFTWNGVQAVELSWFVLCLARARLLFSPLRTRVNYVRKDLFSYQMPVPSIAYCYLSVPIVTKLHALGMFDGHLVASLTFPIDGLKPTEELPLSGWQKRLYLYDLRNS